MVHRDLKPENVILARDGLVKLMDFGIARALGGNTTTQTVIGTPGYMAPEQSLGKAVDQRTDLYALGLIMYECLTGRRAFSGATPVEVALKQIKEQPLSPRKIMPNMPPHLEAIVLRCLEKEPARRFASSTELLRALAKPVDSVRSVPRWRKPLVLSALGLLAMVAVYQFAQQPPSPAQSREVTASADISEQRQIPPELIKLYEAANRDDSQAQERIGRLYLEGPERKRDERKAFFWIRRAALGGDQNAQHTLALMYENGRSVTRNLVGAYVWYQIAQASGHEAARASFERIKSQLSSEEIAEGELQMQRLRRRQ